MDWDKLFFNTTIFVAGVFMLDYGADRFIDHTVIVSRHLAVVIAAILQKQSSLALGNVMGSTISNILGAFSLGLLFHPGPMVFDQSAKVYTALLLLITTAFSILAYFKKLNRIAGGVLVATFIVYIIFTCYAIHRGMMACPEASESDSDNDTSDDERPYIPPWQQGRLVQDESETSPLLPNENTPGASPSKQRAPRSLFYHIVQLIIGLFALTISGYLLSRSASAIADCFHLSGTVIGLTVVSFATTLPEKMIAIISSTRGHSGIVVASTAGSNVFLLTLCAGIIALAGLADSEDQPLLFELFVTWVSSVILFLVVFVNASRLAGALLLVMYMAFLILEFTVYRR
ncbi:hypothetical protein BDV28DRAFT_148809 [Aspergillus coremiiformis]|uniref:Sodium/calcium exchanger membrane region domain-containing protein n=1 Tax=Aspergillus coremiiformis TaxID=138285 RepID=A0A5N6Z4U8_9EURO|nr:hypothetical protein BDV28DRAFT_148809 [Aspergillus coremiiformis]